MPKTLEDIGNNTLEKKIEIFDKLLVFKSVTGHFEQIPFLITSEMVGIEISLMIVESVG